MDKMRRKDKIENKQAQMQILQLWDMVFKLTIINIYAKLNDKLEKFIKEWET
jgi:hypothetical protein